MSETTPPVSVVDDYELRRALQYMLSIIGNDYCAPEGSLNEAMSVLGQELDYDYDRAGLAYEQIEANANGLSVDADIPELEQHLAAFWHARDMFRRHFEALAELVAPGWLQMAIDTEERAM